MKPFCFVNRSFFLPFLIIWGMLGIIQLLFAQNFLLLFVNKHWSPWADFFFMYSTYLGDGVFILIAAFLAAFFSYRLALKIFLSYAISGLLVQFFKHIIFTESPRPPQALAIFMPLLHKVEGVTLYYLNSFPSGHTTSAFAFFTILALDCKSCFYKPLLLIPPLLVAYSRMYLLAHFMSDVYMAAFIGIPVSVIVCLYLDQYWRAQSDTNFSKGLSNLFNEKI